MKIINKQDNKVIFSAEIGESLANAIRRFVNQVPVLAIDDVEISKNESPLYDETVAHRIGLVPLKMGDKPMKEDFEDKMKIKTSKEGIVYSEEIKGSIEPVFGKIPLTILKKGQEMEIVANARIGRGVQHTKYSPGLMFYRNAVKVSADKDCPKEVVNICPRGILKLENGKIICSDNEKCDVCDACVDLCKKEGKGNVSIENEKEKVIITIESFGQMSENEIFKRAIGELKKELKDFSKKISK